MSANPRLLRNTKPTVEIKKQARQIWSEKDKWKLLRALKKYGYEDLENIYKEFPCKTEGAVKMKINKLHRSAERCNLKKKESQLDAWIDSGLFSDTDDSIPLALKFISLFEKHPSPYDSAGCDFRYLSNTSNYNSLYLYELTLFIILIMLQRII